MGSCGAQKVSISQSCSEAHVLKGPGMCKLAYLLHVCAECLSQSAAAVPWGAQGDSQTSNILSVENHASGPHSWSFPAFAPLHLLVEETDDGDLLVYFFPELLSRLILSEIIPCSPQYGANLRYARKRLCGVHHICSGPTSHIMHLFFNERHCSKFHSNQKNIYWIVASLIMLIQMLGVWGLMTR